MTTKHTPGPWEVLEYGKDDNGKDIPLHLIWVDNPFPCLIAQICFAPRSEANARLIAMAPEMLDALKRIIATRYQSDMSSFEALEHAELIIQKATMP